MDRDLEKCWTDYEKAKKDATSNGEIDAALLALLPIPLSWFLVYKSIALIRWIREGFEPKDT